MGSITRDTSFKVEEITVINLYGGEYSVLPNLLELALFRSMENIIGSGYVKLVESISSKGSFRTLAGLFGEEGIRITIYDESEKKSVTFFFIIYALDNVQILEDKRLFTLRFTEPFGIANSFLRIGQKYSNINCSEAVEKIGNVANTSHYTADINAFCKVNSEYLNEIFEKSNWDSSTNLISFLVPMWHPLKSMLFFANSAVSSTSSESNGKVADCVLFTDHMGKFHLESFSSLFNHGQINFVYSPTNLKGEGGSNKEKRYGINQLSMSSIYNIQEYAKLGILGKRLYEADLYTLAGSQNEKQLGVPQLMPAGSDANLGTYPYKDFTAENIRYAAGQLYSAGHECSIKNWLPVDADHATVDHLYEICYYNGANDKSEKVLEEIIEPKNLRGNPVKNLLTYFKISIRIPLEVSLDVGSSFNVECNDSERKIDEIASNKFVISSVAHYITLTDSYTLVEAFSIPSQSGVASSR